MQSTGTELVVVVMISGNADGAKDRQHLANTESQLIFEEEQLEEAKSFNIPKALVWNAFKRVKENKGAAGIDNQTISDFEGNLKGNLYKLWNRMSSGSYFPSKVRCVNIPKKGKGERKLSIPTITDRVAQMVVKLALEPNIDGCFHPDSFGYRPNKSGLDAVAKCRERCWKYPWVIDLDIKAFFDNVNHDLLMKALKRHAVKSWEKLYIERWLKTCQHKIGLPQGGVISPLLANLFLHYAFDMWLQKFYPHNLFERYADDAIVHCKTQMEAIELKYEIAKRLRECGLELHSEKTKIGFCKNSNLQGTYKQQSFDFLGYCFRPRITRSEAGNLFVGFTPAISPSSAKAIRQKIRQWRLGHETSLSLEMIAQKINPCLRGWINYYGIFNRSILMNVLRYLETRLFKYIKRKYKKRCRHLKRAKAWLAKAYEYQPNLFVHWQFGLYPRA